MRQFDTFPYCCNSIRQAQLDCTKTKLIDLLISAVVRGQSTRSWPTSEDGNMEGLWH